MDGPRPLNEGRNLGASRIENDLILFVDDDNTLAGESVREMASAFEDGTVGAVSPLIYNSEGKIWFSGMRWSRFGMAEIWHDEPLEYRETEGFHDVFMVRRGPFERVGGFNPGLFPFYLGEADLAERLKRLGYRFVVAPKARVWHHIGKGRARRSHIRTKERAYLVGRNRLIFLKLYYPRRFFLHLFILPFLMVYHLRSMDPSFRREYLRGVRDGL